MADEATGNETEGTEPEANEAGASSEKTYKTQAEVDAIVRDRLARERSKYTDYDELKAKAAKLDELEAASQSELEREKAARERAEAEKAKALETANVRLVNAAILAEAAKNNVKSPELLMGALDKSAMTVGDDGQVTGVEDAVKAALDKYPELVGKTTATGSADQGARGGGPDAITREQLAGMSPAAVQRALKAGKLNHLLGN